MTLPLSFHILQRLQNSVRTGVYGDRRAVAPKNYAVFVDHKESAFAKSIFLAVRAVGFCHCAFRLKVGKQREMQMLVFCKCGMTPRPVDGNSENLSFVLLKLGKNLVV